MNGNQERSRISEAFDELSGYRDDGEDVIENLDFIAAIYSVPVSKLREIAELNWGAPLETDRQRNGDHFESVAYRNAERARAHAHRNELTRKAKDTALEVWDNCCPNGEPSWDSCAERFLILNKIEDVGLQQEISDLILNIGRDFQKSVSLYNKWAR